VADRISGKPYVQNGRLRSFDRSSDIEEFVWHRDKKDRKVKVIEGQGWQLQYNGDLPVEMIEGKEYHIPSMLYHRIIPGFNNLKIEIKE